MCSNASSPSTSKNFDFNANLFKGFMASGLAAVISKTTVAPMDRVKLILQLQNGSVIAVNGGAGTFYRSPQYNGIIFVLIYDKFSGIVDCFRKLCAEQGPLSLWRGNFASVIRCLPSNTLNLALRDFYRPIFLNGVDRKTQSTRFAVSNLFVGGLSAATALCFVYPLDFARTRIAVDVSKDGSKRFNGMYQCFKHIYMKEGIPGMYSGFFASLQFVVLSRAIFFGIFDTARVWLSEEVYKRELSFITTWSLAQVSIITSSVICYPWDTVRRKLMMESGEKIKTYKNSVDCFTKILRNEGASSLFKGSLSNSLKCTSGALILAIYYEVVKYM